MSDKHKLQKYTSLLRIIVCRIRIAKFINFFSIQNNISVLSVNDMEYSVRADRHKSNEICLALDNK